MDPLLGKAQSSSTNIPEDGALATHAQWDLRIAVGR